MKNKSVEELWVLEKYLRKEHDKVQKELKKRFKANGGNYVIK